MMFYIASTPWYIDNTGAGSSEIPAGYIDNTALGSPENPIRIPPMTTKTAVDTTALEAVPARAKRTATAEISQETTEKVMDTTAVEVAAPAKKKAAAKAVREPAAKKRAVVRTPEKDFTAFPEYTYKDFGSPTLVYTRNEEEANDLVQCLKG